MNPNEAILELEDTYNKELTVKQTEKYQRFLGKFKPEDIGKIIIKAIEESTYLPRISQLNEAAKDLLILEPDRRKKPDKDCPTCRGTGWRIVETTDNKTGKSIQAVKACGCKDDPGAPGPQGVF